MKELIKKVLKEVTEDLSYIDTYPKKKGRLKRFVDSTKKKLSDFIHPKCGGCGEELTDYGTIGSNPEPLYVCDNKYCDNYYKK